MAVIDIKELPISPNRDLKTVIGFDAQNELIKATYTNNGGGGGIVDLSNYYTKEEVYTKEQVDRIADNYYNDYMDDYDELNARIDNIVSDTTNNIVIGSNSNITNREWLDFIKYGNKNVYLYKRDEYNGYTKYEYLYNLTRSTYSTIYSSNPYTLILEFDCTDRSSYDSFDTRNISKTYVATLTLNNINLDSVPTVTLTLVEDYRLYDVYTLIAGNTAEINNLEDRIQELETKVQELENRLN